MAEKTGVLDLIEVVHELLDDNNGCPWCEVTSAPELLGWLQSEIQEVAYELDLTTHCLEENSKSKLMSASLSSSSSPAHQLQNEVLLKTVTKRLEAELGDILFNTFLLAHLCEKLVKGQISLGSVADASALKIRYRCPYVFDPDFEKVTNISDASAIWKSRKKQEKKINFNLNSSNHLSKIESLKIASMGDAIVIFTKFPTMGQSKTRLIPQLGEKGAYQIALSMLEDVILNVATCTQLDNVTKVILFAPSSAYEKMRELIRNINLDPDQFHLIPMINNELNQSSSTMTSSNIGDKLMQGLMKVRELKPLIDRSPLPQKTTQTLPSNQQRLNGSIAFIGMDCPELSGEVMAEALAQSRRTAAAKLCPSNDGGYVLLALPPSAPLKVFKDVKWSSSETAFSQINAISLCGIPTLIGLNYDDMDEYDDLLKLKQRTSSLSCSLITCKRSVEVLRMLFPSPSSSTSSSTTSKTYTKNHSPHIISTKKIVMFTTAGVMLAYWGLFKLSTLKWKK